MSGFSQKRSSCGLGWSSMFSFYSHLQRWVCLASALVFRFLRGKQLFWNLSGRHGSPHDGDAVAVAVAVAGAAGALLELSADTRAPAPLCGGSQSGCVGFNLL